MKQVNEVYCNKHNKLPLVGMVGEHDFLLTEFVCESAHVIITHVYRNL